MRLFRWWFNGKTVERVDAPVEPKQEIAVGSLWTLRPDKGDPFPAKNHEPSRVLEVKDGWVRYYLGAYFPDERETVDMFLFMYEPVKEAE
jgi:hypothetical protein